MKDRKYIESGVWKCADSPTGAHHWIEVQNDGLHTGLWYCKWCHDSGKLPTDWNMIVKNYRIVEG